MTEAEWLKPGNLSKHIGLMWSKNRARKLRLFGVACCAPFAPWMYDPVIGKALLRAELLADGELSESTIPKWLQRLRKVEWNRVRALAKPNSYASARHRDTYYAACCACSETRRRRCANVWGMLTRHNQHFGVKFVRSGPGIAHAFLLEVFGNPFRPVTFSPSWRTATAVTLARQMYESRDFSAMPILADALQDAGCDSAEVLDHCRGPGPHVRGCWVCDLVLGKE